MIGSTQKKNYFILTCKTHLFYFIKSRDGAAAEIKNKSGATLIYSTLYEYAEILWLSVCVCVRGGGMTANLIILAQIK